jgi:hypothetical protein
VAGCEGVAAAAGRPIWSSASSRRAALAGRRSGWRARQVRTSRSSAAGTSTSGLRSASGGASSLSLLATKATGVVEAYGSRPVSISYAVAPKA